MKKGQLQQYKSLSMLLGLLCPIFFSIDLLSAQIFPIKLLLVDPVYQFLWISPSSINLISALFFKSSCSWSTGYALFVDCHIDCVYAPFFQLRCSWWTGYAHFCGFPHLPLTLYAFYSFQITLLLMDLVCQFFADCPIFH